MISISQPLPPTNSDPEKPASFPITRADEMEASEGARDFVEGLLTEGGASVTYGASNSGKTFWLLDLGAHVATGKAWRHGEVEIDQGAVVYVCLEGTHGMQNRIEAMKRAGILTPGAPFYVCTSPVSLLDATHADKLAETVREAARQSELPCRLVIIDTMARAMAGGDENSGKDMTFAVSTIDAVKQATGAHVAIIHHCGKDEARGARGHSSLRAAVDTEIEVSKPEGERITTVRVTKQRDLERGEAMPFSLKVIELGTNHRGKVITSCTVHHEDEMMASQPKKSGRAPKCTADDMLQYLPADTASEWQRRVKEETGLGETQFYNHKRDLEQRKAIRKEVGTNRIIRA
jgi:RecA-family ATPase